MKVAKLRATTAEWQSVYPWHFGWSIPSIGPVVGIDRLAGGSPFGLDPLRLVIEGHATNPNMVVAGAPGNGKSAFVKQMSWNLVGAFGYRFVATDVKGEYRALAEALGAPVLDLRPGGPTRINPLQDPDGRHEFTAALASLCLNRSLESLEQATLTAALKLLPAAPVLSDLLAILREMPASAVRRAGHPPRRCAGRDPGAAVRPRRAAHRDPGGHVRRPVEHRPVVVADRVRRRRVRMRHRRPGAAFRHARRPTGRRTDVGR